MNILNLPEDVHREILLRVRGDFQALTSTCKTFHKYATHAEIDARSHHLLTLVKIFPERNWSSAWLSKRNITWEYVKERLEAPQSLWERIKARVKIACCRILQNLISNAKRNIMLLSLTLLSLSALYFAGVISNKNKLLNRTLSITCLLNYIPIFCERKTRFSHFGLAKIISEQQSILDRTHGWNFSALSKNSNITWEIIMNNFYHPATGKPLPWHEMHISCNPNITWDIVMDNPVHPITNQPFNWLFSELVKNPGIDLNKIMELNYYHGEKMGIFYNAFLPGLTSEIIDSDPLICNAYGQEEQRFSQIFSNTEYARALICDLKELSSFPFLRDWPYDFYDYMFHHHTAEEILQRRYNHSLQAEMIIYDELCSRDMISISTALEYHKTTDTRYSSTTIPWCWSRLYLNRGMKFENAKREDYFALPAHWKKILSEPLTWRVVKDNPDFPWDFSCVRF